MDKSDEIVEMYDRRYGKLEVKPSGPYVDLDEAIGNPGDLVIIVKEKVVIQLRKMLDDHNLQDLSVHDWIQEHLLMEIECHV